MLQKFSQANSLAPLQEEMRVEIRFIQEDIENLYNQWMIQLKEGIVLRFQFIDQFFVLYFVNVLQTLRVRNFVNYDVLRLPMPAQYQLTLPTLPRKINL